jgi:hypothetical protein
LLETRILTVTVKGGRQVEPNRAEWLESHEPDGVALVEVTFTLAKDDVPVFDHLLVPYKRELTIPNLGAYSRRMKADTLEDLLNNQGSSPFEARYVPNWEHYVSYDKRDRTYHASEVVGWNAATRGIVQAIRDLQAGESLGMGTTFATELCACIRALNDFWN